MMYVASLIHLDEKRSDEVRRVTYALAICAPSNTSVGQTVQAFVNWAEANPKEWQEEEVTGAWQALHAAWSCKPT